MKSAIRKGRFVFRQARADRELAGLLGYRYRVFGECRLRGINTSDGRDTNAGSDNVQACYYGLFLEDENRAELVGGIRVVVPSDIASSEASRGLSDSGSHLRFGAVRDSSEFLSLFAHTDQADAVKRFLVLQRENGMAIVELTQLVLSVRYRSRTLARSMVESAVAVYFFSNLKADVLVTACNASQKRFYSRYGFACIPGADELSQQESEPAVCALAGTPDSVAPTNRQRLRLAAKRYDETGCIEIDHTHRIMNHRGLQLHGVA